MDADGFSLPPDVAAHVFRTSAFFASVYWPILTYPITIWVQVVTIDRDLCEKTFQIPLFLTIVNGYFHAFRTKLHLVEFTGAIKLFVQEGAVYFIAISAINLANAIMNLLRVDLNDERRMSGIPTGPTLRFTHPEDDELTHATSDTTDIINGYDFDQGLAAGDAFRSADNYNCFSTQVF
ncbi:hypothetical protein EXIGLDRAFT_699524 [Exidia glandulosa HHB12029]|uniref:Uncharacterized protein n=1 Tax=Exidia glandulosa HHB12029 TaxID=1314781 RepID=A0A165DUR3_EXIGL|nr:hypothetical protein EXIGLDRAFT_699524 [Exidia glandulosa HHB12029]